MKFLNKIIQTTKAVSNRVLGTLVLASASLIFFSCNDGDTELDSMAKQIANLENSYMEQAIQIDFNGGYYNITEKYTGVPVKINSQKGSETVVTATVDPSLVENYNTLFSESNKTLPEGAFSPSNEGSFTIPANSLIATDSMHVELANADELIDSTVYLVPVRLSTSNNAELQTSVVFYKVLVLKSELFAQITGGTIDKSSAYYNTVLGYDLFGALSRATLIANNSQLTVPVELTRAFDVMDTHVTAKIYNTSEVLQNVGSSNIPIPDNVAVLEQSSVLVKAGKTTSEDALIVSFKNLDLLENYKSYSLVLTLEKDENDPQSVSPITNTQRRLILTLWLY